MSKMIFKLGLGCLLVAGVIRPAGAAQSSGVTLSGHVPAAVAGLSPVSALATTTMLHLAISLPLRNQSALNTLLQQQYDSSSTNYHRYLTPAQFAAQFGATAADYQSVATFAQANGLTVTATHPNRLILDVVGSAASIQNAFHVQLKVYNHPTESRTFFAPTNDPVISSSLPILHVSGLDNYYQPHPKLVPMSQNTNSVTPKLGSGPGGSYLGSDFRKAYVPGTTLTGAGQSVGLLQFDGFYASDIAAYASAIGLTNPPSVITVPIDGGVSVPGGGNGEVCLDIEMIFAMAPGVANVYVYEAPNPSPWVDLLSRMANDNLARQLSCSWGGGAPDAAAEQIFQQMALQGQSFYNAVGDSDAFNNPFNPPQFPEDSPHITQVGGTTLTTAPGAGYTSEKVWNWGGGIGSCGGISTFYSIPTWQQGVSMANNQGSTTMRNMPDVALTADNVYVISDNGVPGVFGGTSCAAPLWAAYTALINQQGTINGKPAVGFVNPALYALASTTNYANVFNDVTNGDNTWSLSPSSFFAVPGYDLCTGLGTPKGTNLINALVGLGSPVATGPIISAPVGPWGTNLAVMNGSNPNGAWFLFVQDDKPVDIGSIANGWYVTLTSANPVGFAADNALYATPTNLTIAPSTPWSVTLSITNYGPSLSTNVLVSDDLPSGLLLVSNTPSAGVVTTNGNNSIAWNLPNLPINTGATLVLNFFAGSAGIYTNTASVSAGTSDPNPDDDVAVSTLIVSGVPPLPPQLTFANVPGAGGGFQLNIGGNEGSSVIIQASTNLINWVGLITNLVPFTFTDTDATNYPSRFYRAIPGQ